MKRFIWPVSKLFVPLQRSKTRNGIETVGKSRRPFLYQNNKKRQANRPVVCGSSNARKDKFRGPEQHHKPFLFNVQKHETMNEQTKTAGETAIGEHRDAIFNERVARAQDIISNTSCALIFYYDDIDRLRTFSVCEDGYEHVQLEMLSNAASIAKGAVDMTFGGIN